MTTMTAPSIDAIRSQFPGIAASNDILLDNAGGSQVPRCVADAIRSYMLNSYVQLGADYELSQRAGAVVDRAHNLVERLMNAQSVGRVILGPSTTALTIMIAESYARRGAGDHNEIIIAETSHEACAGPFAHLADRGFVIHNWPIDPKTTKLDMAALDDLLSERTLLVSVPLVSNIFGRIEPIADVSTMAHSAGARVFVDAVAYAPHRALDVASLGADFCAYSTYKVFGPHMAALFARHEATSELEGPYHYFIDRDDVPYKFEPGGVSYEGAAGITALSNYLGFLTGVVEQGDSSATDIDSGDSLSRQDIERAFEVISMRETALQQRILSHLADVSGVTIIGPTSADAASRVCTISFVHDKYTSREIAMTANNGRFGIRYGHFYSHRLCTRLADLDLLRSAEDGVVRISPLHYNTEQEIDALAAHLRDAMV